MHVSAALRPIAPSRTPGGAAANAVIGLPRNVMGLDPRAVGALLDLARANASGVWPADGDIARARNKHVTNRLSELREGLAGAFDWLEVDVRMHQGSPVAAHDAIGPDSLRMRDWLAVCASSGRGLKFDIKEWAALEPTIRLIEGADIPDERLVLNVGVLGAAGTPLAALRDLRQRFPRAVLNLSPNVRPYASSVARSCVALALQVGGPIAFPLDVAKLTPEIVRAFRRGGRVSAWNDPRRFPCPDVAAETARLRRMGVDGTIDLRS